MLAAKWHPKSIERTERARLTRISPHCAKAAAISGSSVGAAAGSGLNFGSLGGGIVWSEAMGGTVGLFMVLFRLSILVWYMMEMADG